ncbi:MAG: ABC transporter substrate-binding protein [Candidatus Adiutrix sp.]|nr:ABC transporter substrate-binding protein [Candidatus Adiutrix sp.]
MAKQSGKSEGGGPAVLFLIFLLAALLKGLWAPEVAERAADSAGGLEVVDMTGRLVHLDGPARRAVLLTPLSWHYLTVTRSDESIIMVPPYMKHEFAESVLGRIFPALAAKPVSIFDTKSAALFSAEQSLLMNPDVILSWDYLARDLEKIKFRGLIKITGDGRYKEKLYEVLGELTGQSERVEQMWARYRANESALFAKIPAEAPEKTLIVIGNDNFALWRGQPYKKYAADVKKLRARNMAEKISNTSGPLNMETLLQLDPDFIFINPFSSYFTAMTTADIYAHPVLRRLKAVSAKRVYHMPLGAARLEGPYEDYLFLLWSALVMRPELDLELDLRSAVRETYLEAFGYEMSEDEIDAWLRFEENKFSAGYARLGRPR